MTQATQADVIQVWPDQVPDAEVWRDAGPELERPRWENSRMVRNVSVPSLTVFEADPATAIGTSVIVCPGGAFHFLMVDKEGSEVARWLNARGVTAFVLRYRLVPTPDDDACIAAITSDLSQHRERMNQFRPYALADGLQALRTVRQHADRWQVDPVRLGILGFSAGAFVTAGAASAYTDAASRPSFAAPIYGLWGERAVPPDAPPLFLAAATDDPLVDVQHSLSMYAAWKAAGKPVEMHLYAQGGHGFGMNRQGLPSDSWIDRFWEWLVAQGFAQAA
jgi:acetyl esterase/lipase